jgi:hypothetical protein
MSTNRGTKLIRIPIQIHIGSYKLNWRIVRDGDKTLFAGSVKVGPADPIGLGDAWDLVRRYLSVIPEDEQSVLDFLVAHGEFDPPAGSLTSARVKMAEPPVYAIASSAQSETLYVDDEMDEEMVFESFSIEEFAMIQDYVRRMLITGNPTLPTPWHAKNIQRYEILFARARSGTQAQVSVYHTFPSILATVQFKLAQGARFRRCYRKDCGLPYEVTSRHTRRFCSQYCAHITSLRQRRKASRKAKTGKKG